MTEIAATTRADAPASAGTEIAATTQAGRRGPAGTRSAWIVGGCLLVIGGWVVDALVTRGPDRTLALTVDAVGAVLPLGFGLARLWWHRDDRFARLLVIAGVAWWVTTLGRSGDPTLYSLARVTSWGLEAGIIYLLLAFPLGRLRGSTDRRLFRTAVLLVGLLYLPTALLADFPVPSYPSACVAHCPHNVFALGHGAKAFVNDVVRPVRELVTVLLFCAVAVVLVRRSRRGPSVMRYAIAPVAVVAAFRVIAVAATFVLRVGDLNSGAAAVVAWIFALSLPTVTLGFMAGLVGRRLFVARALGRLADELEPHARPAAVRAAVAHALDDPSLRIVYPTQGAPGSWVDEAGSPASAPRPRTGRSVTEVTSEGHAVAVVEYDLALSQDPSLVRAATSYALTALENDRLAGELRSSLEELAESRARVVAVGDRDRRRLERDLHDGAQQRLVALRVRLELVAELLEADFPGSASTVRALTGEVDDTIDEVRSFARGVYPSLLAERGLAEALRAAARSASLPTTVAASRLRRYPSEIETTVYFSCMEALQNAAKHAPDASAVTISVAEDPDLRFEVNDDGPGFDVAHTNGGAGLANLRDRLAAVGGQLDIRTAPGQGTCIGGVIPLPSRSPEGDDAPIGPEGKGGGSPRDRSSDEAN